MEIYLIIYLFIYLSTIKKRQKKFLVAGQPKEKNTGLIDYTQTAHLRKMENID